MDAPLMDAPVVRRGIAILSLAVLVADAVLPPSLAVDALYILPVLASLFLADRTASLWTAVGVSGLSIAASGFDLRAGEPSTVLGNGAISLCAVWVTAGLVRLRLGSEEQLSLSRRTSSKTLQSIGDGVITADASDRILFLNRAAEELTGWRAEDALERPLGEVFRVTESKPGSSDRSSPSGKLVPGRGERTLIARDGRRLDIEATTTPLSDWDAGSGAPELAEGGRVLVFRDVTERKRQQELIEALAFRDHLTGLPNRASFIDRLELELAHARRRGTNLALLFLDLDRFKDVNDTLGHAAGDALLVAVGQRLREVVRAADTVARLGGDEFTIVLPDVGHEEDAQRVAEKVDRHLSRPYEIEGHQVVCGPSIGIALFPRDAGDLDGLLRLADGDMYRAKHRGRGTPSRRSFGA